MEPGSTGTTQHYKRKKKLKRLPLAVLFPPACLRTSGLPTEAINTLKMIQMNLLRKQKEAHRLRVGTWGSQGLGGREREDGGTGYSREFGMDMYALPYLK